MSIDTVELPRKKAKVQKHLALKKRPQQEDLSVSPIGPGADERILRRYKIATHDLRVGMFVAELDRPWLDTPFLIQGFAIDSDAEMQSLSRHCRFVYVDLDLSDPTVVDSIRSAEMKKLPIEEEPPRRTSIRSTIRPGQNPNKQTRLTSDGRNRFKRYLHLIEPDAKIARGDRSIIGIISAWLDRLFTKQDDPKVVAKQAEQRAKDLLDLMPKGIELKRYDDLVRVEEELPRARKAFKRSEDVMRNLASDVRAGRLPSLEKTSEVVDDIVQSMIENPDAMMWVARMREEDSTTYGHAVKVALYMVALGRHLGFPKGELSRLGMIGLLADVGKTKLPRAMLEKPGMLTPQEYSLVKEHVRLGLDALNKDAPLENSISQGIAQHHERLDGSGYPKGLKGHEIGIYGRMAAIADTFSALITPRVYANPVSPHDALLSLFEWAGTSFHEPLVEQFVQAVGVFPVGSLVELSSKEIAIVLAHNKVRRLEPRVLVLTWADKTPMPTPIERDLFKIGQTSGENPLRILRGVPPGSHGLKIHDYYGGNQSMIGGLI